MKLNPKGEVPVLLDYRSDAIISDSNVIIHYLDEKYSFNKILRDSPEVNAEARRLSNWFDTKFFNEVIFYILHEKIIKYYLNTGSPNIEKIRAAKNNISYHLNYIDYLLHRNKWLACNKITLADYTAAAHLSVLDYLGDVNWSKFPEVKNWYALIKSRPSFSDILSDNVMGFEPNENYCNLDF